MKKYLNDVIAAATIVALMVMIFPVVEPGVVGALTSDGKQVTIRQEITSEISMTVGTAGITMSAPIAGLTGGSATGTTTMNVITNNTAGYKVVLTASSSGTMVNEDATLSNGIIAAYPSAVPQTWAPAVNSSNFGYSVTAGQEDVNQAGTSAWKNAAGADGTLYANSGAAAITLLDRATSTLSTGANSSLNFQVTLTSNPIPAVSEGFYTATTTLTATMN